MNYPVLYRAIKSLVPANVEFYCRGDKPTSKEDFSQRFAICTGVDAAGTSLFSNNEALWGFSYDQLQLQIQQIEETDASLLYQEKRAEEYPPITDYLDGVVKGDQAQIDNYIAACQAIKAKYPKP